MLTIRVRTLTLAIAGFVAFTLLYVSVGIRWHTYRARASLYARQEVEHTFEAAHFARAALHPGYSAEASEKAAGYRKIAETHEKAARECARLREFYENCW